MKVLSISTVHDSPNLLLEQIDNYKHCFNNNIFQIVHVNKNFQETFENHSRILGIDFKSCSDLHLFSSVATSWGSIFHAFVASIIEAQRLGVEYDYIYFHSNSDLLVKRNVDHYIAKFDLGSGIPVNFVAHDFWAEKILENEKMGELLLRLGQSTPLRARSEGCFFKKEIFYELIFPLIAQYDFSISSIPINYPLEEVDLINSVELFCKNNPGINRTRNIIYTSKSDNQFCSPSEIESIILDVQLYGIKRFSNKLDDSNRLLVKRMIGLVD